MVPDQIKKRLQANPFRPFELHLSSGTVVKVPHPDFAFMPPKPNEWDLVIYDEDHAFNIIDVGQVACLKEIRKAPPKLGG